MLLAGEVKGELARIQPARACCRRAELLGLMHGTAAGQLRTMDHATARTAVLLAASLGVPVTTPRTIITHGRARARGARHHLVVDADLEGVGSWAWQDAPACDRRSFLRGALLGSGSISFGPSGPHVEFVHRTEEAATDLAGLLSELGVRALGSERRGHHVVYLKGQDEIALLFGLVGANRGRSRARNAARRP